MPIKLIDAETKVADVKAIISLYFRKFRACKIPKFANTFMIKVEV